MAKFSSLFVAFVAASVAAANPIVIREAKVKMPFDMKFSHNSSMTFGESERMRGQAIVKLGMEKAAARAVNGGMAKRSVVSVGVTNTAVTYVASVGVGCPATTYTLLIDTGSSNTWIGASKGYNPTDCSEDTGNSVQVSYGSGSFSGEEYIDQVTLSSSLVIGEQSIGVADSAQGFDGVDGILGIGPVDLTQGTTSDGNSVPTVTDNLFAQGTISSDEIGISYNPTTSASSKNGELTFGGVDSSKFTGSITFASTSTSPANEYWGINQSIKYGSSTILSSTAGIVDTGTTLVLIATNAFNTYKSDTGATLDSNTGLLKITSSRLSSLQSLFFVIGGTSFELTANAQLFPRSLNSQIGGTSGNNYLIVADLGSNSGQGLDFINGYTFLERFYSVYDSSGGRVGIATTPNTKATSN